MEGHSLSEIPIDKAPRMTLKQWNEQAATPRRPTRRHHICSVDESATDTVPMTPLRPVGTSKISLDIPEEGMETDFTYYTHDSKVSPSLQNKSAQDSGTAGRSKSTQEFDTEIEEGYQVVMQNDWTLFGMRKNARSVPPARRIPAPAHIKRAKARCHIKGAKPEYIHTRVKALSRELWTSDSFFLLPNMKDSQHFALASKGRGSQLGFPDYKGFHRFPKLPIELRFMIWKYALPTKRDGEGHRIITTFPKINPGPGPEIIDDLDFTFYFGFKRHRVETSPVCFDTNLLSTTQESRGIFLETFKNKLASSNPTDLRVAYFDNQTTIYFTTLGESAIEKIVKTVSSQRKLPACFATIRRLGLSSSPFMLLIDTPGVISKRERDLCMVLRSFDNLEFLTVWKEGVKIRDEETTALIKKVEQTLKKEEEDSVSGYKTPIFEIIERCSGEKVRREWFF